MYYCSNCKKKFRNYRRKCPICGGPCHRSDNRAILLIVSVGVLFLLLLGLIILLVNSNRSQIPSGSNSGSSSSYSSDSTGTSDSTGASDSTGTSESSTPPASSTPPQTSAPPATTLPSTSVPPTSTGSVTSGIGMYTRAELEALSTKKNGYGPGSTSGGKRAPYAESDQKKYSQYGSNFIAPDNGNVYLTFDCGYEYTATDANGNKYRVTEKILDVLKEKNAKGVFFITMYYAKSEPDLVQRMIDEGHVVGNHSNNHKCMPDLTIDKMEYEVMSLHEYVLEHFNYTMTLFRPPEGAYSVQSLAVVQNLGYKTVHWSFAYLDYNPESQPEYDTALDKVKTSVHSGAIYLLHAVSETNAAILGEAIDYFREAGYNIELFT